MSRHALVCFPTVPDPDCQSGSLRAVHLMEFLREDGWSVTLVAQNTLGERDARSLQQGGIPVHPMRDLDELLSAADFDVAVLAFWSLARRLTPHLRARSPRTKVVVDSLDLHFMRTARERFMGEDRTNGLDHAAARQYANELNAYAAADAVLAVSEREANLIADLTNGATRAVFVPDAEELPVSERSFSSRRGILFLANFQHPPNSDALEYLCTEIVPRLNSELLDHHPISIVGNAFGERAVEICRATAGVKPVGWVPSVVPYFAAARMSVIPLRYGAGTKRKLIQSLMIGTPAVSTSVGAEGLELSPGTEIIIADGPVEFAEAIGSLVEDEDQWKRLASAGRKRLAATHARSEVRSRFLSEMEELTSLEIKREPAVRNGQGPSGDSQLGGMKQDWDRRARENAMHFIASGRKEWDGPEFFAGGKQNVEEYVADDLERISRGRDPRKMRALEIGCGIGRMTRHLAGIFGEVHGVDVSGEMIAQGREHLSDLRNVFLYETNGSDLSPFPSGYFNFAFSYIVFQHIPSKDVIISYFREVQRTLKSEGLFKFQVQGQKIERPNTWVGVGFSEKEVRQLAEDTGFAVIVCEGQGTQYFWNWWVKG